MIVCPNCNHHNPEGALQCENCSTPLPATTSCPNCGASVQTDATFCGQCGFNLQVEVATDTASVDETKIGSPEMSATEEDTPKQSEIPTGASSSPISSPWDEEELGEVEPVGSTEAQISAPEEENSWIHQETGVMNPSPDFEETETPWTPTASEDTGVMPWDIPTSGTPRENEPPAEVKVEAESSSPPEVEMPVTETSVNAESPAVAAPEPEIPLPPLFETKTEDPAESMAEKTEIPPVSPVKAPEANLAAATRLQLQTANLFHVQTNTNLEIPANLAVIHLGKPNTQIPPDIDVSGFPNSEVVSRVHADIRVEGDAYFIEDVGSSNGTYINHSPLLSGNRHRLRTGDRIALGKGDLVTFIFQLR